MTQAAAQKAHMRPKGPRYLFDPLVLLIVMFIAVGFGGFSYWAATAPLAQGITAPGVLALKDQRRTMQHLEGGIISAITIREGQAVSAGEVLVTLTDASASARLTQVQAEMSARPATPDAAAALMCAPTCARKAGLGCRKYAAATSTKTSARMVATSSGQDETHMPLNESS